MNLDALVHVFFIPELMFMDFAIQVNVNHVVVVVSPHLRMESDVFDLSLVQIFQSYVLNQDLVLQGIHHLKRLVPVVVEQELAFVKLD